MEAARKVNKRSSQSSCHSLSASQDNSHKFFISSHTQERKSIKKRFEFSPIRVYNWGKINFPNAESHQSMFELFAAMRGREGRQGWVESKTLGFNNNEVMRKWWWQFKYVFRILNLCTIFNCFSMTFVNQKKNLFNFWHLRDENFQMIRKLPSIIWMAEIIYTKLNISWFPLKSQSIDFKALWNIFAFIFFPIVGINC